MAVLHICSSSVYPLQAALSSGRQAGQHSSLQLWLLSSQTVWLRCRQVCWWHCHQEERTPPLLPCRARAQTRQWVLPSGQGAGCVPIWNCDILLSPGSVAMAGTYKDSELPVITPNPVMFRRRTKRTQTSSSSVPGGTRGAARYGEFNIS